ncbi:MAG: CvpA family protein [Candidatus Eisenbacteria sp.]|nr:CvpA family protein [Candidatus Eisenbacteria bacterium]
MNVLDWIILAVMGILVIAGLWKGLIRLVFAVLSVLVSIVLACLSTGVGTQLLTPIIGNPAIAAVVAFIVVFVAVLVIMGLVARALSKAVHVLGLGWADRLGGAVLGLAGALLVIGAAFLLVDLAGQERQTVVRESRLAPLGFKVANTLGGVLPEEVRGLIGDRGESLEDLEDLIDKGREKVKELPSDVKERISDEV